MMSKDHEYLYPYSAQEAKKRNQLPMWRESYHANVACRNAIEETIRQNFDGMHLKKDCLEPVLAEYGYANREDLERNLPQSNKAENADMRGAYAVSGRGGIAHEPAVDKPRRRGGKQMKTYGEEDL